MNRANQFDFKRSLLSYLNSKELSVQELSKMKNFSFEDSLQSKSRIICITSIKLIIENS